MKPKPKNTNEIAFTTPLHDLLNTKHPLYILSHKIDWKIFETSFEKLYSEIGRPAKPIRLMVGLLILKHLRNISDENIVEQWSENAYYQYFCGEISFANHPPCEASELVHFRKRIGEEGIELILKESIRINGNDKNDDEVSIDTTVQEKNITYPIDAKLHRKIIKRCQQISQEEGLPVRQSYTQTLKKLGIDQRFRNHPTNKGKARKADKKIKTIAGRLVREIERNLPPNNRYQKDIDIFNQILSQQKTGKNKIYSVHEPDVQCISKGKEHKKYEFGNKVSIAYTQNTGVIIGAKSFRNEYDGHTLTSALEQVEQLIGKMPKEVIADRGYRGKSKIGETTINIPKPFSKKQTSRYQQEKLKRKFKKRAAIEPIIGHLKSDHRLSRNFYGKIFGDNINVMLSAASFNFKRMMNKWKSSFWHFLNSLFHQIFFFKNQSIIQFSLK